MSKNKEDAPIITPKLKLFLFAMILANIGAGMYPTYLTIYLRDSFHIEMLELGTVFTITSTATMLLQIFGGWLSDTIGRLKAIVFGSLFGILGIGLMYFSKNIVWMTISLVIMMVPGALVGPSFSSFIAESSSEEYRGRVYGITDTVYRVVNVIGPFAGGLLMYHFGFRPLLLISLLIYAVAAFLRILMVFRFPENKHHTTKTKLSVASFKKNILSMTAMLAGGGLITWIFIVDGVSDIAMTISGQLRPLFLKEILLFGENQIGYLGAINAIAAMSTPLIAGKISDRWGERIPIMIGTFLLATGFLIFINMSGFIGVALAWVVAGIGGGLVGTAFQAFISKAVPNHMLGTFTGVFNSSVGLLSLPIPLLGTYLWEEFSPRIPFLITALLLMVSIIPIWFKFKLPRGRFEFKED